MITITDLGSNPCLVGQAVSGLLSVHTLKIISQKNQTVQHGPQ